MKRTDDATRRKPGRPLSFDRDAALQQAMLLFWRQGYEATTLRDLTDAMGVTPPSLYAAFGDKKGLFRAAVGRYLSGPVTSELLIAGADSARDAAWGLLQSSAAAFTGPDTPTGCLLASGAISCSPEAADVQRELAAIRQRTEGLLRDRIVRDIETGEIGDGVDADALAGHVMAVIQGMSTLARDGATRPKLLRIAETAIHAWPAARARAVVPFTAVAPD